jgi:hypothetical protein
MNRIADNMVAQLKNRLGIKSPSKVFEAMGSYSGEGLIRGLDGMKSAVGQSAEDVGQTAIDGMKKSISGLGAMLEADVDMTPVIAPVLDLSSVRKDASGISALFEGKGITLGTSYSGAADATNGYMRNKAAADEAAVPVEGDHFEFTQINNSPKALSQAEIYRQTNNQISRAKGALTTYAKSS